MPERNAMKLEIINDISKIGNFLNALKETDEIFLDTETSTTDTITCKLYLVQILVGDTIYIFDCIKFKDVEYLVSLISPKVIVGHNVKYDIKVLYHKSKILLHNVYDTMLAEVILHQGVGLKYISLAELVKRYLGKERDKSIRESFYSGGILDSITQQQIIYAAEDVIDLPAIKEEQIKKIKREKMQKTLKLELELVPVVAAMEIEGVLLNQQKWTELMELSKEKAKELADELRDVFIKRIDKTHWTNLYDASVALGIVPTKKSEKELIKTVTNPEFFDGFFRQRINIASPSQLIKLLHSIGYTSLESTGEKIIQDYRGKDPDHIFEYILEFREQYKRGTSFGQGFLDDIHPVTGKIHSDFNQLGTATGRFSSGNPNLQQIVSGSDYRKCFIAPSGYKMIICDYSQQELKLAGAASKEPEIINAYKNKTDLHSLTASALFEKDISEITEKERSIAKGFNFAILYGSTEYGLAYNFNLPVEYTKTLLQNFYKKYKTLKAFKTLFENAVLELKYSRTLYGRKRYFEKQEWYRDAKHVEQYENRIKREGFNHLIQGTAADVTKLAMIRIFNDNPYGDDLKIIMTIHDEIVCIAKEDCVIGAKDFVVKCMNDALQMFLGEIPSEVDWCIDEFWFKTKKKVEVTIEQTEG
jgi:DNA polymerase I